MLRWYVFQHPDHRFHVVPMRVVGVDRYQARHSAVKVADFGSQAMADADVHRREEAIRRQRA